MSKTTSHGTSADGVELTDDVIDRLTAEAEIGYDVDEMKPRMRRGRPPMGAAAAAALPVRLDPDLRSELAAQARREGVNQSEVMRRALRDYLKRSREQLAKAKTAAG